MPIVEVMVVVWCVVVWMVVGVVSGWTGGLEISRLVQ